MKSALATEKIGDAAVAARTGKTWKQWYAALDKADARNLDHRGIVALAGKLEPRTSAWWRQMVTVSYEQARGLRKKHQRPEGYEISASKTIAAPAAALFRAWTDAQRRRRWLDGAFTVRTATKNKSLRLNWYDGETRVEVAFYAKGAGKAQVVVQHSRLPGAAAARRMQAYWKTRLEKLAAAV